MGAEAFDVVERGGRIAGVRYRAEDGEHEIAATLTVATDGRRSIVRQRAGMVPKDYGAPMDVLWFRMSREDSDPPESFGRFSPGHIVAMIDRGEYWQVGYVIPKGADAELRQQGIETLRASFGRLMPAFADRTSREPASWDDVKTLEVQVNRLKRWHRPGPAVHRRRGARHVAGRGGGDQPGRAGCGGRGQRPGRALARGTLTDARPGPRRAPAVVPHGGHPDASRASSSVACSSRRCAAGAAAGRRASCARWPGVRSCAASRRG